MAWHDFAAAVALLLVIEGIFPFVNPHGLREALRKISELTDQQLRIAGLASMLLVLLLLYLIK